MKIMADGDESFVAPIVSCASRKCLEVTEYSQLAAQLGVMLAAKWTAKCRHGWLRNIAGRTFAPKPAAEAAAAAATRAAEFKLEERFKTATAKMDLQISHNDTLHAPPLVAMAIEDWRCTNQPTRVLPNP